MTVVHHQTPPTAPELLSNNFFPRFSLRPPSQLVELAASTKPVQKGLLSPHHAAYCLAWNTMLNTDSRPLKVLYSGIGPDISTPLLTTNATRIAGTELMPVRSGDLKKLLKEWDIIDTDPELLRKKMPYRGQLDYLCTPQSFFLDLRTRRETGFWVKTFHEKWGLEWCLMYELKALGVNPASIKINDGGTGPEITFNFQHPSDSEPKPRVLEFMIGLTQEWMRTLKECSSKFDLFYAKSNDQKLPYESVIQASRLIHNEGAIILGYGSAEKRDSFSDLVELDLSREELPPEFLQMMDTTFRGDVTKGFARYGWKLEVYRKAGG